MKRAALHCLVVVALVAATLAIWHWRFIAIPGPLPETRLAKPLVGWSSKPHQQHQVTDDPDTPVLRLQRAGPGEKSPGVQAWLGPMEGVRFIHVRCESRWDEVDPGPEAWKRARFVVFMKDRNGKVSHPPDSVIFVGDGTRDWFPSEAVLELTGEMVDTRFALGMLGKSGVLEVRRLSLIAVKQRPWVPFAAALVVIGWVGFCASLVRRHRSRPAWWRAVSAASLVVAFSWVTVFPQTKGLLRPVLDQFAIGELPANSPQIPQSAKPATAIPKPPELPKPPPAQPGQAKPPSEAGAHRPGPAPPAEARHSGTVRRIAYGLWWRGRRRWWRTRRWRRLRSKSRSKRLPLSKTRPRPRRRPMGTRDRPRARRELP